ncbi:hypothetical protein V8E36_003675 [Tilletia maclaganii]
MTLPEAVASLLRAWKEEMIDQVDKLVISTGGEDKDKSSEIVVAAEDGDDCDHDGVTPDSLARCDLSPAFGPQLSQFPSLTCRVTHQFEIKAATPQQQAHLDKLRVRLLTSQAAKSAPIQPIFGAHRSGFTAALAANRPDQGWSNSPVQHWAFFGASASGHGNPCPTPSLPQSSSTQPPLLVGAMLTFATSKRHMAAHHSRKGQSNYTMSVLYSMLKGRSYFKNLSITDNRYFANRPDAKIAPSDVAAFTPGMQRFMSARTPLQVIFSGSNRYNFSRYYAEAIKKTGLDLGSLFGVPALGLVVERDPYIVLFAPHPSATL